MRMTVIVADRCIYINNFTSQWEDDSWLPEYEEGPVHALQWHDDHGEIEFASRGSKNLEITELGPWEYAIELHEKIKVEWEKTREEARKLAELDALLEYDEDQINEQINYKDDSGDVDYAKLESILDEIDYDLQGANGYAELIHADEESLPSDVYESVDDILAPGALTPDIEEEKEDVMMQDLSENLKKSEETSYDMEDEVENQIYYDIEELLKEI